MAVHECWRMLYITAHWVELGLCYNCGGYLAYYEETADLLAVILAADIFYLVVFFHARLFPTLCYRCFLSSSRLWLVALVAWRTG
jgi:hypothetical protein